MRIDVVEVPPADQARLGGRPWAEVVAEAEGSPDLIRLTHTEFWHHGLAEIDRADWVPPTDRANKPVPFLPLGRAWLREVNGRSFLYWQNWSAVEKMPKSRFLQPVAWRWR